MLEVLCTIQAIYAVFVLLCIGKYSFYAAIYLYIQRLYLDIKMYFIYLEL